MAKRSVSVYLEDAELDKLDRIAAELGWSRSAVLGILIDIQHEDKLARTLAKLSVGVANRIGCPGAGYQGYKPQTES